MKAYLVIFGLFFSTGLLGQQVVRDTFTDHVNDKRYVVSGYFVVSPENLAILPPTPTGYYVTTMQMHNDWHYLTTSFALEALKRKGYMNNQDTLGIRLANIIEAKDIQIDGLRAQLAVQDTTYKQQTRIYKEQSVMLKGLYEESTQREAELSLMLDKQNAKRKNWQALSIGFAFTGLLVGIFAFH